MIEINLLPEELKLKSKKSAEIKEQQKEIKKLLYVVSAVVGLLLIAHLSMISVTIAKSIHLAALNLQWRKLDPQRKQLEEFQKEYSASSANSQAIQELINKRIDWSEKLNNLSLNLPSGIWFNEISASGKSFNLRGTVVSLAKEEVNLINQFLNNLKRDNSFFKDFVSIELGPLSRRSIQSYDVIDFTLNATLKNK